MFSLLDPMAGCTRHGSRISLVYTGGAMLRRPAGSKYGGATERERERRLGVTGGRLSHGP